MPPDGREHLGRLLSHADVVLWRTDATGALAESAGEGVRGFGYPHREILGLAWWNLVHPDDVDPLAVALFRASALAAPMAAAYRLKRRNGEWRQMVAVAVPDCSSGELAYITGTAAAAGPGLIGVSVDVTVAARDHAGARFCRGARCPLGYERPRASEVAAAVVVSIPEAARRLGVSTATLYRYARVDPSPPWVNRIGRVLRVDFERLKEASRGAPWTRKRL